MVKQIPIHFIKQYFFWMLFFVLNRTIFIVYNYDKLAEVGIGDIWGTYWHAIYLDNSMACYMLIIPFIVLFFQSLIKVNFLNTINKTYSFIIIIVISIITSSELGLYQEWGIKINYKALSYLSHPSEVINSATSWIIVVGIILILLQSGIGIYSYQRFVHQKFKLIKRNYLISALFLIIIPVLIVLGVRGGIQQIPINQSDVYFSKNNFINTAAVNSTWNLFHSIDKNRKFSNTNPFNYYHKEEAGNIVDSIYSVEKDTTIKILNTNKPNIVLLILEGWSADLIYSLGGYKGITPEFEKLVTEGLLFTDNYSSGTLSHHAMASILSGFPATPSTSITKQPDKFQQLPCIVSKLKQLGYFSSFYFGGQLSYGNIKGYIYYNQFDKIIEGADFPQDIPRGKLGVHDEYLFTRHIKDLNSYKEPFFTVAFTLSSHSPYDGPMKEVFSWGGKEKDFINSVYYADKCLGDYFRQAKQQKWYNNTLFILIADHSHSTPKKWHRHSLEFRKIPMLFYGNVLKDEYRGEIFNNPSSQIDIPATLLAQLGMEHQEFKWSKNLFNPYTHEFTYYSIDDGLALITPADYFVYDHELDSIIFKRFESEEAKKRIVKIGKSHLQILFDEYLKY